ncbi:FadR/GntR family transcriptional regulator [Lentzea flava]|uniref:GntR family transcriptional regulator n=1 Tax=Lentzea flava TaxID=103732 RepID=A0ABQ2UVU4_9PSEU|nr:FCD domain-containing protein [Lentzea flava]MCP2201982.1 DNA-binding transcriptional regulator, FadR family [Lentzea flava]GGU54087.1 GntR family transcriptional regulator [Lentzea flava]
MSEKRLRGVHGQTVEALAGRILAGEIGEGDTLDLPALREELDVSLTALREALKVLTAKGMIDARQKRGTFVQPRSSWNLLDTDVMRWQTQAGSDHGLFGELTEMRVIVEPAAARLAAERATDADVEALAAAVERMASARDLAATVRADLDFHRLLMAATHNTFLTQVERIIAIGLAERDKLVHGTVEDDPVPSHRAVLDAITARDPEAAYAAMRALVDKSGADLDRLR